MGLVRNILPGPSGNFFGLGWVSHLQVYKFFAKNLKFSIFYLWVKKILSVWVKKYHGQSWVDPIIYCGSEVCSGWVGPEPLPSSFPWSLTFTQRFDMPSLYQLCGSLSPPCLFYLIYRFKNGRTDVCLSVGMWRWRANGNPNPYTDLDEILHAHSFMSKEGLTPHPSHPWAWRPETLKQRCSAGCILTREAPGTSASWLIKI